MPGLTFAEQERDRQARLQELADAPAKFEQHMAEFEAAFEAKFEAISPRSTTSPTTTKPTTTPQESTMPDQTTFDSRVTALRVANPALSLGEARAIAHSHASEEGFYAPAVADGAFTGQEVNGEPELTWTEAIQRDIDADPRVAEALRWDALSDSEKATEAEAEALVAEAQRLAAAEAVRWADTEFTPQGVEYFLTQSTKADAVRKVAARLYAEQVASAPEASDSVADLRASLDGQLGGFLKGDA